MEERKEKEVSIIITIVLFIIVLIIDKATQFNNFIMFFIYLVPYIIISIDTFKEGIEGVIDHNFFNEDILIIIASLGAMLIGFMPGASPMYNEAISVMLFYQIGELFEIIAEGKSEREVRSLMSIRPDYAYLVSDGKIIKKDPKDIEIGDVIEVKAGEKVPLDGVVVDGTSFMNTVAITGESTPIKVKPGDLVYSGAINKDGTLQVKTTKSYKDSTASRIIDLIESASSSKSKTEKFITKFSRVYTPIVIVLALIISIMPSIIFGNLSSWILKGLTFLIISCPCALVISVPLAFFGGIGGASHNGILFKGANYLERITKVNTIIFDKTGTLTEGVFEVSAVHSNSLEKNELLHMVAHVEEKSNHPIAESIVSSYKHDFDIDDGCRASSVEELEGLGIKARVNGKVIYVGNEKLMNKIHIKYEECKNTGTIIHVADSKNYLGHIVIADKIKKDARRVIKYFKDRGVHTIMLTGDKKDIASSISKRLGLDEYYAELMPDDKLKFVDSLIKKNKRKKKNDVVAFVGDGINDSPSLARCDIGISFGGIGQDAAVEAADVILMNDNLTSLIDAINISNKTLRIARENIVFAITIKVLTLLLTAVGLASMWMAVFADVGVTIIAVLNSFRTLK